MDQRFLLVGSIAAKLEDFILLTRLGFDAEADIIFRQYLEPYRGYFPVLVENATRFIESPYLLGPHFDDAVSRYSSSQPEYWLLRLMRSLSDVYSDQYVESFSTAKGAGVATEKSLCKALALARDWHDHYQTLHPDLSDEVTWHATEVYLEIIVLAKLRGCTLDRKHYQAPGSDDTSSPPWAGFISSCAALNAQQKFWRAQRIVGILLPVLSYTEAENLFQRYLSSLEGAALTRPTAVARLAASKNLLSRMLVDPENWIADGTISQTVQDALSIRPVVEYLFMHPEAIATGTYHEWRQELWRLIDHEKVRTNQPALSILLNVATVHGIRPILWAGEIGNVAMMETMVDVFSERLGLQGDEDREEFVSVLRNWGGRERCSLFWWALDSDSADVAKFALAIGEVTPNTLDENGTHPLIWAARYGRINCLRLLLDLGQASPDLQDLKGRSPLSWAAEAGHEQVIRLLVDSGKADPDLPDLKGRTPLAWAACEGHAQITQFLLRIPPVNPNSTDSNGWTPLISAAANGHHDVVDCMVESPDLNPDSRDNDGWTALSWAAAEGHFNAVWSLLQDPRVDPSSRGRGGATPLHRAIIRGHFDTASLLLDSCRVDVNMKDNKRRTPLTYAIEHGRLDLTSLLLANHANPAAKSRGGWSPLLWATVHDRGFIAELLLWIDGVDVNVTDVSGRTAVSHAAERSSLDTMKTLLSRAHPDLIDDKGWTPLMYAAERGSTNLIRELLATGKVDPAWSNPDGWTARKRALLHGHDAVVKLLDEHLAQTRLTRSPRPSERRHGDDDRDSMDRLRCSMQHISEIQESAGFL